MSDTYYVTAGALYRYQDSEYLRPATPAEAAASQDAARHDGGAGVIGPEDLSGPVATRGQIVALRDEAGEAGDTDQVAICALALRGDLAARAECARVIAEARRQS